MHRLPAITSRISSAVGAGFSFSSSCAVTIMSGVQKPGTAANGSHGTPPGKEDDTMRSIRGIGLAVLVASLLAGASAASAQTIRVGFHAPLTGFAASDGKSALN